MVKPTYNYTLRTKRLKNNRLFERRQLVLQAIHPKVAAPTKQELAARLCKLYKVKNPQQIVLFGWQTKYGGGKSSGFALLYNSLNALRATEQKYRIIRNKLADPTTKARKGIKEKKNRSKKVRGAARAKILTGEQKKK